MERVPNIPQETPRCVHLERTQFLKDNGELIEPCYCARLKSPVFCQGELQFCSNPRLFVPK
jgi:hypothetical protein